MRGKWKWPRFARFSMPSASLKRRSTDTLVGAFERAVEAGTAEMLADDTLRSIAVTVIVAAAANGPASCAARLCEPPRPPAVDSPTLRRLRELIEEERGKMAALAGR